MYSTFCFYPDVSQSLHLARQVAAALCPLYPYTYVYPHESLPKKAPPQTNIFYFLFLPPIGVAAMSTSPHKSILCPMLANHFILHAKSPSPSTGHE